MILSTECMKTKECSPLKHHYDECAERVQRQEEEQGKAQEDCVEECEYHQASLRNLEARLRSEVHTELLLMALSRLPHDALRRPMRRA